jgi:hypothetical protein
VVLRDEGGGMKDEVRKAGVRSQKSEERKN